MRSKYVEAVVALLDEIIVITVILYFILYLLYDKGVIGLEGIVAATAVFIAVVGILTYRVAEAQASRVKVGSEALIGLVGEVIEDLDPEGKILLEGEIWNAVSRSGETIRAGERVRVTSFKGLTLIVERVPDER